MSRIELRSVEKSFGKVEVIPRLDLDIADGGITVFVGPSGCGKSTLLRLICGLEELSGGEILIDGVDVARVDPSKRGLAMVFQSYALYPHMTVRENIAFSLKVAKLPAAEIETRLSIAAGTLQLTEFLDRYPRELSGGQRQRVAIGRAIVREPKAFLFDEPLSNLDAALRGEMRLQIAQLHEDLSATMIYVTHDQTEAMTLADWIVVLNAGRIEQAGPPHVLYNEPANLFVARFIGNPRINLVALTGATGSTSQLQANVDGTIGLARPELAATVGVRPEHIAVRSMTEEARGDVHMIGKLKYLEYFGPDTIAFFECAFEEPVAVRLPGRAQLQSNTDFGLHLDIEHLVYFDNAGNAISRE